MTWLHSECRDLIRNILQVDPAKRLTIAQILAHPWFTIPTAIVPPVNASQISLASPRFQASPVADPSCLPPNDEPSSAISDGTFHSASSEFTPSGPATPDEVSSSDPFYAADLVEDHSVHRISSEATIRKATLHPLELHKSGERHPEVVLEEPSSTESAPPIDAAVSQRSFTRTPSQSSKAPPALPTRTPVRTKRRSVSSTLSESASPGFDKTSNAAPPQDFASLLSTPAPLIFSTPLERDLLNSLSTLGFDTGQIVHSVLSDACDATGSLWWMLKRKAEKKAVEDGVGPSTPANEAVEAPEEPVQETPKRSDTSKSRRSKAGKSSTVGRSSRDPRSSGTAELTQARSAPELQFIPATPTGPSTIRPDTPPQSKTPPNPLLSPSSSTTESVLRSQPSTPGGSLKDKDGSKGRKARSGSVSIMQRATTALEAAGLVRKKSADAVRDDKDKDKEKNADKRLTSSEEARSSHGSGSSKLVKTPPMKAIKDSVMPPPMTPPSAAEIALTQAQVGSPWVMANAQQSPPSSRAESPGDTLSALPNISAAGSRHRNRGSLLSTFRMWFKEDTKGKRKEEAVVPQVLRPASASPNASPVSPRARASVRRRQSATRGKVASGRKTGPRAKRASMSSRRSSSVNSRRSSVTSNQYGVLESPSHTSEPFPLIARTRSDASRRSFGSHTPISDREEYVSRPSSIQSFVAQQRHRKSPSASSAGSLHPARTSSPLPKFHRRAGSGSSTRVVRQVQPHQNISGNKPPHLRSNSASSAHSLASSRPGSLYDLSENESRRNSSPVKAQSRHSMDDTPRRNHGLSTFVAHKRQTPFSNPGGSSGYLNSIGRSSWKKSWGMEPPGWQSRSAHPAIEVLAISPPDNPLGIRDVFSGRQSLNLGDESDWVDEDDDDIPGYAGGLGQMPSSATSSHPAYLQSSEPLTLSVSSHLRNNPAGRASGNKRSNGNLTASNVSGRTARGRVGHSPVGRSSPLPPESSFETSDNRGGRRQLPAGRSGPAFRHPIQEEDEGEEE